MISSASLTTTPTSDELPTPVSANGGHPRTIRRKMARPNEFPMPRFAKQPVVHADLSKAAPQIRRRVVAYIPVLQGDSGERHSRLTFGVSQVRISEQTRKFLVVSAGRLSNRDQSFAARTSAKVPRIAGRRIRRRHQDAFQVLRLDRFGSSQVARHARLMLASWPLEPTVQAPEIQVLGLKETRVTDEGVKKLQQALPNCKIER